MIFWVLCVAGWIALWFRPDWRVLAIFAAIVALPGAIFTLIYALQQGVGIRSGVVTNMGGYLLTSLAYFGIPGAAVVVLRRFIVPARKDEPARPS